MSDQDPVPTVSPATRRLRRAAVIYLTLAWLAGMWPVYPYFSRIDPLILGMPFSLFYLVCLLVVSFFVMLGLFLWESRRGELE